MSIPQHTKYSLTMEIIKLSKAKKYVSQLFCLVWSGNKTSFSFWGWFDCNFVLKEASIAKTNMFKWARTNLVLEIKNHFFPFVFFGCLAFSSFYASISSGVFPIHSTSNFKIAGSSSSLSSSYPYLSFFFSKSSSSSNI